jgi:hypothetical protein
MGASSTAREFKRGTTFDYSGYALLPARTWEGSCELYTPRGALVGTLEVTITPGEGAGRPSLIRLHCDAADTASWALGTANGDIVLKDNTGVVLATSSFSVPVVAALTAIPE